MKKRRGFLVSRTIGMGMMMMMITIDESWGTHIKIGIMRMMDRRRKDAHEEQDFCRGQEYNTPARLQIHRVQNINT